MSSSCKSCRPPANQSGSNSGRKNSTNRKEGKTSNCDVSHCELQSSPVLYKANEKNYSSEHHGAWRRHPHNKKWASKYKPSKTSYLVLGPDGEIIWDRLPSDLDEYYKRCYQNRPCRPPQYRGYSTWLKPEEKAGDNPDFTRGPNKAEISRAGVPQSKTRPGGCNIDFDEDILQTDRSKKRFRFLDCGPVKTGWGCSSIGQSCFLNEGFEPKRNNCNNIQLRRYNRFKGEGGCETCCDKMVYKQECNLDFESWKQPRQCGAYVTRPQVEENPPRTHFGRKVYFKALEKVPPINFDLVPFLTPKKRAETKRQIMKETVKPKPSGKIKSEPEKPTLAGRIDKPELPKPTLAGRIDKPELPKPKPSEKIKPAAPPAPPAPKPAEIKQTKKAPEPSESNEPSEDPSTTQVVDDSITHAA